MDPLRIAIRCILAYAFLLLLLRLAGKRVLHDTLPIDLVLALVIGDLVDDVLWSQVTAAQFIVAAATLVIAKLTLTLPRAVGRRRQ